MGEGPEMRQSNVTSVRVLEAVIEVTALEGKGEEGSPIRNVMHYYTPDGKELAHADTWAGDDYDDV